MFSDPANLLAALFVQRVQSYRARTMDGIVSIHQVKDLQIPIL